MKILIAAFIAIGLLGCETMQSNPASSSTSVHPGNIYEVCMSFEKKAFTESKKENPELVAHYVCSIYKGVCKSEPTGESCQKGIREYSEKMK